MGCWVTLKNGKVLNYSVVNGFSAYSTVMQLTLKTKETTTVQAIVSLDVIERIDFVRPTKIYREPRKDKLPVLK